MESICIECRHCIAKGEPDAYLCANTTTTDVVTGEVIMVTCRQARSSQHRYFCGPDGAMFDKKSAQ